MVVTFPREMMLPEEPPQAVGDESGLSLVVPDLAVRLCQHRTEGLARVAFRARGYGFGWALGDDVAACVSALRT